MINIDIIEQEILDLEKKDTTYAVIERLAWLYIVKDHIASADNKITSKLAGSEFAEACSEVPVESLIAILSEHFETIKILYPKEYYAIIEKIENVKS